MTAFEMFSVTDEQLLTGETRRAAPLNPRALRIAWENRIGPLLGLCPVPGALRPYAYFAFELGSPRPPREWFDQIEYLQCRGGLGAGEAVAIEEMYPALAPIPPLESTWPGEDSFARWRELRAIANWHYFRGRDGLGDLFLELMPQKRKGAELGC